MKAYCSASLAALPWLFGEIIVVEAVFNAPGLGLGAWRAAKARDYGVVGESLGWLIILFTVFYGLNVLWSRNIGKKLKGYV